MASADDKRRDTWLSYLNSVIPAAMHGRPSRLRTREGRRHADHARRGQLLDPAGGKTHLLRSQGGDPVEPVRELDGAEYHLHLARVRGIDALQRAGQPACPGLGLDEL